jgi:hypothetical protein
MISRSASPRRLLQELSEDVRAFCVEKNSAAPDIEVVGGEEVELPLVVPYASFLFTEVLKNAAQARVGAWGGGGG